MSNKQQPEYPALNDLVNIYISMAPRSPENEAFANKVKDELTTLQSQLAASRAMGEKMAEALKEINKRAKNAMKQCTDGIRPFVASSDIYTVSEEALTAYEQQEK